MQHESISRMYLSIAKMARVAFEASDRNPIVIIVEESSAGSSWAASVARKACGGNGSPGSHPANEIFFTTTGRTPEAALEELLCALRSTVEKKAAQAEDKARIARAALALDETE